MTQPFECEVRFRIEDIDDFEARLGRLEARVALDYEFTDHYYTPVGSRWNPVEKNLRIREWIQPRQDATVYFVKLEVVSADGLQFKRALLAEGKLALFAGPLERCRALLEDLGFEPWFSVRKEKARLWEVPKHGFLTAVEYIRGIGWTAELEFEGQDPGKARAAIQRVLEVLEVSLKTVTHKPVSVLYLDSRAG